MGNMFANFGKNLKPTTPEENSIIQANETALGNPTDWNTPPSMADFHRIEDQPLPPQPNIFQTPEGYNSPLLPGENPNTPVWFHNAATTLTTPLRAFFNLPFNQRAGQSGAEVMTGVPTDKPSTGSTAGNVAADLVGSLLGFATGGEANAGVKAFKLAEDAAQKFIPSAVPNVFKSMAGLGAGSAVNELGSSLANNSPVSAQDMAVNAGANALLGALPYGIGKAADFLAESKLPKLELPPMESTPLQDVQNAYRVPSSRDVKQQELAQTFSSPDQLFRPQLQAENPSQYFGHSQADLESAFGAPKEAKSYRFTTGEQRAFNALQDGIQNVQNSIGHNDILAPYPAGTTLPQAFADIKTKTGVDLQALTDNLTQAQGARTSLTPEELRMGRVAGVIPDLKPRELPATAEPTQPNIFQSEPRVWTNKDAVTSAGPAPLHSITQDNLGQLPGAKSAARLPGPDVTPGQDGRVRLGSSDLPEIKPPNPENRPQIVSGFSKDKLKPSDLFWKAYRETVNNTQGINRTVKGLDLQGSENPAVMAVNSRNAGGTVNYIEEHGLVDMSGKPVLNKSIMDAFNGMPKDQQNAFDEYLFHLHNIDRVREGKPVFGYKVSAADSQKAISTLEKSYPGFKDRASTVRRTLDGLLNEWGVKSGLVSPELRDTLQTMYKNYVPTYRKLEGVGTITTKTRAAGPAKLINTAIGGDEPLITLRESIPMLINKTVKAARKNEVYQGILNAARANPENGFAKVLGKDTSFEGKSLLNSVKNDGLEGIAANADKALQTDPKLGYLLTVMEHGQPVKMQVTKELFDSLKALDHVDDTSLHRALQIAKKYTTNPFKSLITGYNPLFAVRNAARDIPTAFIQGTENNPLKFVGNLGTAAKEMVTKSPRFEEYKALGGEGGNYFNVERGLRPDGKLKKVANAIGALNNFTETLPRYGEYVGALKRGGEDYTNKMQALHNAAEVTVNFSRHGNVTKAVDAIVPYLNPSVQGVDKFARSMSKPVNVAKAIGIVTTPTAALYVLNQTVNKAGYDQLDNRMKDTYFLIPQSDGKPIKIPKSREAGVLFGALFERLARTVQGQAESFKGFGSNVATNFVPNNPFENGIISPFVHDLPLNKDFAGRPVVPAYMVNDKRSPRYQYDEQTSEIAKKIGDTFNLSPKQIDFLIKSYTGIVGQIVQPLATKNGASLPNILSRNFVADPLYNNEILNNFYQRMDGLRQAATDKNITQNIPSRVVTPEEQKYNAMLKVSKEISALKKQQLQAQTAGDQNQVNIFQSKVLDLAKKATK